MNIVIDDDKTFQLVLKRQFQRLDWDSPVVCFDCAQNALNFLIEHNTQKAPATPVRIFLDLNMPGMDGWTFLHAFEQMESDFIEKIKVYILSGSEDRADINKAKDYKSVHDYLIKPMRMDVLNRIMSSGYTSQSPSLF